jgi:hypothetical protein
LEQIAAVARRYGPLTGFGVTKGGESLTLWRELIGTLHELTTCWTLEGVLADPIAVSAASIAATELQVQILERGGRFVPYGAAGIGLVPVDMDQWWRVAGMNAVFGYEPMRRCRFCGNWFSLANQRSDNGFCRVQHRDAFHQKRQLPSRLWAEVI